MDHLINHVANHETKLWTFVVDKMNAPFENFEKKLGAGLKKTNIYTQEKCVLSKKYKCKSCIMSTLGYSWG